MISEMDWDPFGGCRYLMKYNNSRDYGGLNLISLNLTEKGMIQTVCIN